MTPSEPQGSVEDILKSSFLHFLWYVWVRVLALPAPTRVQKDIARYLVDGPRRRFIAAFRGVGKTFLTGAYIVWRLWRDPDLKVMVVSANERFANTVAAFVHTLINAEDRVTRESVPWAELRARGGQRNSTLVFDVGPAGPSKDPSLFAVGIGGQMTGGRADLILSDDVEVPSNSETEGQREKLEDRTNEFAAILKPGGEVIYLGTFQTMQSIYRKLKEKGYGMRLWPARYPLRGKMEFYETDLAPMLQEDLQRNPKLHEPSFGSSLGGAPTDPERFHVDDLMEREAEWGAAGFTLQFMLDPRMSDAERFPLKTRDLIVMDLDEEQAPIHIAWGSGPKQLLRDLDNIGLDGDRFYAPMHVADTWKPYAASAMEVDPSGSGSDETAYVVTSFLNGRVFLRRWGGFKDGHGQATLEALARIAVETKVPLVRVEGNFGDGMFARLLETELRRAGFKGAVETHKVHGMKEARIVGLVQPVLSNHRLVMGTDVVRQDLAEYRQRGSERFGKFSALEFSGLYQLTHMANQRGALRKDDRIDALANALGYWLEHMALDSSQAEAKEQQKANEEFARIVRRTQVGHTGYFVPGPKRPKRGRGRRVR